MKRFIATSLLLLVAFIMRAQVENVTIVVSSDGATKQDAEINALRSALEQVCGAFITSDTRIIDDLLISDEVVSISRGNIKSYSVVSEMSLPDGHYYITLSAEISPSTLAAFINQNVPNSRVEFNGASFLATRKIEELNKEAERKVMEQIMNEFSKIDPWTRTLEIPNEQNDDNYITGKIICSLDETAELFFTEMARTLRKLSLAYGDPRDENTGQLRQEWGKGYWYHVPFSHETYVLRNKYKDFFNFDYSGSSETRRGRFNPVLLLRKLDCSIEDNTGRELFNTNHSYYDLTTNPTKYILFSWKDRQTIDMHPAKAKNFKYRTSGYFSVRIPISTIRNDVTSFNIKSNNGIKLTRPSGWLSLEEEAIILEEEAFMDYYKNYPEKNKRKRIKAVLEETDKFQSISMERKKELIDMIDGK